ncbi:hypothetical protein LCGC14_1511610 [marine sediment metagenome]|uniref:Uncharacterized protein n=1 Tax=marine sediment metagenome TaxID=412755 RepID=A0A0F9J1B4_9ZZZZ
MIGMMAKQMFFDRKVVTRRVDRTTRRVLSRFGAYVRTTARSSIRRRNKTSEPGRPPSSHVGLLKRLIYFGYDPQRETVVIGPTPLHGRQTKDALEMLEYGGTTRRVLEGYSRRGPRGKKRTVRYKARPFMGPAFQQVKPKLPQMWRDSVK